MKALPKRVLLATDGSEDATMAARVAGDLAERSSSELHLVRLHAMSKAAFLGVVSLCASSVVTGDPAIIYRAMLIGAFLLVTTPISAFVVARAAYLRGERMEAPDALDESGKDLPSARGR
jgi:monovalent cation/proton antiporter MnhG/PhaG subunit